MAPVRVAFIGDNSDGHLNLWVSDGTSLGTSDFTGGLTGLEPMSRATNPHLTLFGHELLFEGVDSTGHYDLWVTDGTPGGTSELLVTGAYQGGLLDVSKPDFTVFGSEVLFAGIDSSLHVGLWVTNGTSTGTSELTVAGAYGSGVFAYNGDISPDFTVFGSELLFVGVDASGSAGLWVTNATTSGTSEVVVPGTAESWLFTNPDFTVLGNEVIFKALGSSGGDGL
jgi:ELWxxDGT repeat protein